MPSIVRLRVVSPLPAFPFLVQARALVTISVGSVIEVTDDVERPGLHSIRHGDEYLFVFARDLAERATPLDEDTLLSGEANLRTIHQ